MAIYGINNNYEILDESRSYYDNNLKIGIAVDGDGKTYRGWAHDPYFKIFTGGPNVRRATKVARIRFDRYLYVYPEHKSGIVWYLDQKEIDIMMNMLSIPGIWETVINDVKDAINNFRNKYAEYGIYADTINYPLLDYHKLPDKATAKRYGARWLKMSGNEQKQIEDMYRP